MEKFVVGKLSKEERKAFYQSKYDYYRAFNLCMAIVAVAAYLSYFFTDCGIFGRFAYETLLPRVIILIPFISYMVMQKKIKDYRIMVPLTYLLIHCIIWCTDWATYLLPDRQHAISGMIIMNLIFVCAGFAAPFSYSIVGHCLLIADIALANLFIHYDNLDMMYMFNIPAVIAVCVMHNMMQRVYLEQYITKDKLEKLVVHDQLTDMFNRNKMKEISDAMTGQLIFEPELNVSMLLIDIDYFKKVNDEYGHEAGDKVLVHLAQLLKGSVRATDYVIRWGGEEFLIVMPGCDSDQAMRIAEKIREKVEQSNNGICKMTISIGVALYHGGDYHDTIKNADEAMYQAKAAGRNKVVLYETAN
nr:GGDEF domain-containing protein [Lachnospiraceae bacterium]